MSKANFGTLFNQQHQQKIEELVAIAKEQGYITYEEINDVLPMSFDSAEQIDQVRSQVKDVKVELVDDRVRAYVVFDLHGKDVTLQLEGKLGAENGYLNFVPVSGSQPSRKPRVVDSPPDIPEINTPLAMIGAPVA